MGLKEWKEEFYPTEAKDCEAGMPAIEHSLKKWQGIAEVATFTGSEEWGVKVKGNRVYDPVTGEIFYPTADNCALCVHYYKEEGKATCSGCPIVKVTGKACDEDSDEDVNHLDDSQWHDWVTGNNADPMVELLERVKAEYKE
jgi:hypothetical protein